MSEPIFNIPSLTSVRKLGFITPSSNVALEILTTAMLSQLPLVSAHYSRIPVVTTSVREGAASQFTTDALVDVAKLIAHGPVETVLWNGTSESWTGEGHEAGVLIKESIERETGRPSSTSSLAQVDALNLFGLRRVALATPYGPDNNARLREYYEGRGFDVVRIVSGLGGNNIIRANREIADTPVEEIEKLIRDADHPDAECVVVPCTNLPAGLVVEKLETELRKPVFCSIVVTLWKALRLIGVDDPIHGWGSLMRQRRRPPVLLDPAD